LDPSNAKTGYVAKNTRYQYGFENIFFIIYIWNKESTMERTIIAEMITIAICKVLGRLLLRAGLV